MRAAAVNGTTRVTQDTSAKGFAPTSRLTDGTWTWTVTACSTDEVYPLLGSTLVARSVSAMLPVNAAGATSSRCRRSHAPRSITWAAVVTATLRTPTLIVQGTRDALGTRAEVESYALSSAIEVTWIEDGDHSLLPRKRSGHSAEAAFEQALSTIAAFVERR